MSLLIQGFTKWLNSVSSSSDSWGLWQFYTKLHGWQDWSVGSFWHHDFQRPVRLCNKKLEPGDPPQSQLFIKGQLQPLPLFIVPRCCQNTINMTLGKLGAIVHTFYCPRINRKSENSAISKYWWFTPTHTGRKKWTQGTRGSFGVGLDYLDKPPQSSAATVTDSLKWIN